jgi:tetratricopeptide (TPR) repeat protein
MKKLILSLLVVLVASGAAYAQSDEIPEAPFGLSPAEVLSIFNGNYNNRDYQSALPFGRWILLANPKEMELPGNAQYRGDRTFDRMITVYEELAKAENDPIIKSALIDTADQLYNRVLEIFTDDEIDRYRWVFSHGRFYQSNQSISDANNKATQKYLRLYEIDKPRLMAEADGYYMQFIINQLISQGERDQAIQLMADSETLAGPETLNYFASVRDRLFSNPQERIDFLLTRGDDLEVLNELYDLYVRTGDRQKVSEMTTTLYSRDPSYTNTMRMAALASSNANYRQAIQYLEEAVNKTSDRVQRRDAFFDIANNYLNLDNLQRAREFARRSSEIDPAWGQPYLKLAEIYGQAVSNCAGGTMTRQDKVVYWLVLDYMDRARTADSTTRQFVDRQYSVYVNAAPSVEEKFYQNWTPGDRIRVDGSLKDCYAWIGETTTVR